MVSVPYVAFVEDVPVSDDRIALAAVGRCRVDMARSPLFREKFQAIVDKNRAQALVGISREGEAKPSEEENKRNKNDRKKLMKEGNAMAVAFLQEDLKLDVSVVDVEIVLKGSDLIETDGCLAACLLDAGCALVVVADGTNIDALDAAQIPKERLMANFDLSSVDNFGAPWMDLIEKIQRLCNHVSIELTQAQNVTSEKIQSILSQIPESMKVTFQLQPKLLLTESNEVSDLTNVVADICRLGKETGRVTVALTDPTAQQLGKSYAACVKTDRMDGLYTTVVCARNGEALGLVYSSSDSVVAALESGRGVYYSRSRNGLWRKGDTSGHFQTLHRLDVDCDGDALRFTVTQRGEPCGAFCHLETLTCWGPPRGLRHLQETLQDRLLHAPEGSYTKRLFDDDELLRDKLVEEAQELSEATDKQHVAEELADVLYFAMTRAVKAGVTLDDAVAELDRRTRKVTRRKGDSKAFRIASGQAILEKTKESND